MYSEEALQMVKGGMGGQGQTSASKQPIKEKYPFLNPFGHSYCLL